MPHGTLRKPSARRPQSGNACVPTANLLFFQPASRVTYGRILHQKMVSRVNTCDYLIVIPAKCRKFGCPPVKRKIDLYTHTTSIEQTTLQKSNFQPCFRHFSGRIVGIIRSNVKWDGSNLPVLHVACRIKFSPYFLQSGTGLFRDFHNRSAILADLVFILTILIKWANFSDFAMPGIG